jgi:ABC-type multidrug transport system fused ATPase/permease subunit
VRSNFGMVLRKPAEERTVRENIAFGMPEATDKIIAAREGIAFLDLSATAQN